MAEPSMKILSVKRFENSFQANLAKAKLESAGIKCFLTNENLSTLAPNKMGSFGYRIELMVSEYDFEIASKILDDQVIQNNSDNVCPKCKSKNVRNYGRYKIPKWILFFFSLIGFLSLINSTHPYICNDCQTEFEED